MDGAVAQQPAVPERLVVIDNLTGIQLLTQVSGDELLFQSDMAPGETRDFRLVQSPGPVNAGRSLVDGRFVLPREDFAWENDRIAFRMYGPAMAKDVNNGIDVWTKRVRLPAGRLHDVPDRRQRTDPCGL